MSLPAPWELQANFCLLDASFSVLYICCLIGSSSLGPSVSARLNPLSYPKEKLGGRSTQRAHIGYYQSHRNQVIERGLHPGIPDITARQRTMKRGTPHWGVCAAVCVCVCFGAKTTLHWTLNWKRAESSFSFHQSKLWSGSWQVAKQPARSIQMNLSHSHLFMSQSLQECPAEGSLINMCTPKYCFNCRSNSPSARRLATLHSCIHAGRVYWRGPCWFVHLLFV